MSSYWDSTANMQTAKTTTESGEAIWVSMETGRALYLKYYALARRRELAILESK